MLAGHDVEDDGVRSGPEVVKNNWTWRGNQANDLTRIVEGFEMGEHRVVPAEGHTVGGFRGEDATEDEGEIILVLQNFASVWSFTANWWLRWAWWWWRWTDPGIVGDAN